MRSEPTHLQTILALCPSHETHPKLRGLATLVGNRLALANRNELNEECPTFTFTDGDKVYSPWDVADLFMHGAIFHGRDRKKREILESLPTDVHWFRRAQFVDHHG